jgi:hypothetical protein
MLETRIAKDDDQFAVESAHMKAPDRRRSTASGGRDEIRG